jgi:hypothetical protein
MYWNEIRKSSSNRNRQRNSVMIRSCRCFVRRLKTECPAISDAAPKKDVVTVVLFPAVPRA